jgi:CRISPR/Cas system Type II protein with McrA/HNH and RuvC-like nuclease domain
LNNISNDVVSVLDPERLFTKAQRYEMWVKQDGKCPVTGKTILEEDINNHDMWAADHIIPYSKGGPTTVENGQLIDKKANQSKSAKMPELKVA